jgi:hypothetical protein
MYPTVLFKHFIYSSVMKLVSNENERPAFLVNIPIDFMESCHPQQQLKKGFRLRSILTIFTLATHRDLLDSMQAP